MRSRTIVPLETAEPKVSLSFAALTGALRRAAQGHWEGITRGYGAVTFTAAEKAINWTSVGFGLYALGRSAGEAACGNPDAAVNSFYFALAAIAIEPPAMFVKAALRQHGEKKLDSAVFERAKRG